MYNNDNLDIIDFTNWNRKMLNICWIATLIAVITEAIIFLLVASKNGNSIAEYLLIYILKPLSINICMLLIAELLFNFIKDKYKELSKYLIITIATLFGFNLVISHYSVSIIYAIFVLPIMFSAYYGSKKITIYSLFLNLLCYLSIMFLYLPTKAIGNEISNTLNICTNIAFMISSVLIANSFIDRWKSLINSFKDISESKAELAIKNFVMEFNSKIEPVTGLYNHKTFYEYLDNLIEQSENFQFSLSLAVLDIDNFKRVNDTYGHSLGDEVIKTLSEIIKSTIGTDDYAARYGGEEFAIIFTDKDKNDSYEIVEIIRKKFNSITISDMCQETFSVSIGVSEHVKGMSKHVLFKEADKALYKAKKTGKNKTILYSPDL